MRDIAYFVPKGQHDANAVLGFGWGPRTVYTDGTFDEGDMRTENQIGRIKEEISELRTLIQGLQKKEAK